MDQEGARRSQRSLEEESGSLYAGDSARARKGAARWRARPADCRRSPRPRARSPRPSCRSCRSTRTCAARSARTSADIRGKVAELVEKKVAAEDQLKRVDIRAPQDGIVHQLTVHTVGGVIGQGEVDHADRAAKPTRSTSRRRSSRRTSTSFASDSRPSLRLHRLQSAHDARAQRRGQPDLRRRE